MTSEAAAAVPPERRKIVIATYAGAKMLDVTGPLQAFSEARLEDGRPAYTVVVASESGGLVGTDTGVALDTRTLDAATLRDVDTLLVAGGTLPEPLAQTEALRAALGAYLEWPRRLGSICTGAFILARSGLLDGREATTHWAACAQLAREYPRITVKSDSIFVNSGRIWTSAGVSAGIDMALAMIEQDLSHRAALDVARGLVLFLKRPGGQAQFSIELRQQMQDARGRFDALHLWIRANLDKDLSVPLLAGAAHMSPRNFARVYQRETGLSPARAVELMRIEAARRLLETAGDPIQRIAHRTGFGDDERMRRAFVKTLGVSPNAYRARFGRPSS
ncbi:GlxA family transcriptional regulator [Sphingomonas morindae]|uniref:DJ-1/PfpI family protein n=1 Tax=Sphingomonas morindae TaxID=1541170 RepID=A0ABY4X977_9SPHN|nr:helix-turn-helix domain-containing protein [Sphingomonas morindae]USI73448.1 DJ-1/PfpI family protein [Sphingomonas morindae]